MRSPTAVHVLLQHSALRAGYPLVDACMRELQSTGLPSNQARLNAASFLACSMSFDWRWVHLVSLQPLNP